MDMTVLREIFVPIIADYVREYRTEIAKLRAEIEHLKREVFLLRSYERGRRTREQVRQAEAHCDDG